MYTLPTCTTAWCRYCHNWFLVTTAFVTSAEAIIVALDAAGHVTDAADVAWAEVRQLVSVRRNICLHKLLFQMFLNTVDVNVTYAQYAPELPCIQLSILST